MVAGVPPLEKCAVMGAVLSPARLTVERSRRLFIRLPPDKQIMAHSRHRV